MAGIYIHIPFCKQACYYCDFHFSTSLKWKGEMLQALITELILRKREFENTEVKTIYFGGGTPSLLSINELQLLLETIYQNYEVVKNPEITLEVNPDDLSKSQIHKLTNTQINRLSIGIQSFFEKDLRMMNRAHTAKESIKCLKEALKYYDNITIDLIYGIPNMSNKRWKKNLQLAFESGVNHISSYALTVEPKTALASFIKQGKYPPVSEELAFEHFNTLVEETEKQDFIQYEISNFGKSGYFSKHNTSYWQGKKYIGIGPSAHSFDGNKRSWNIANNVKYIKSIQEGVLPQEMEELSVKDNFNEIIMTGLRTIWGVPLEQIEKQFGQNIKLELLKNAQKFIEQKLLVISKEVGQPTVLKTTSQGKFLCDGIASDLFMI